LRDQEQLEPLVGSTEGTSHRRPDRLASPDASAPFRWRQPRGSDIAGGASTCSSAPTPIATIGTGGAIVMLSEAEEEYAEMLLKAQPLLDAVSLSGAALPRRPDQAMP